MTGGAGGDTSAGGTGGDPGVGGMDGGGQAGEAAVAGGGSGGTGGDAGGGGAGGDGGLALFEDPPELLSQTGLYADIATGELTPGVQAYQPQFPHWIDGATVNRWVYLPPGTTIDTTDMDNWEFPVGVRLWQEITATRGADGMPLATPVRVETRFIMRFDDGFNKWMNVSYVWNADQSDATLEATALGVADVNGTGHDVPSQELCEQCHAQRFDRAIGFSAIQLAHSAEGVNLTTLMTDARLTVYPPGPLTLPGDATAQAALGYLHGNCGHCHRSNTAAFFRIDLVAWLTAGALGTLDDTEIYQQFVNQPTKAESSIFPNRIAGADPTQSEVIRRLTERGEFQMPPIASEVVDDAGVAALEAWIATLPAAPAADAGP